MSQQLQPQQVQQPQGVAQPTQRAAQPYVQAVSPQVNDAVNTLDRVETIAEVTKTRAAQQGLPNVGQIADDLKNIAELQKDLIVRQSPLAGTIQQCAQQAIQQGIQQLQQYQQPEVQELVTELQQSFQTVPQAVTQGAQQPPVSGSPMAQPFGQQLQQ